ncbi:MAG: hypothetical protein J5646_00680 [Bacteroidales bacterium]|nr:hypothetical protein [Bacteroidales bacterium]
MIMSCTRYIQVILPLKLDWEPYYYVPDGLEVKMGDRVRVIFANAFYVAAVSAVDVEPTLDPARIVPIEALEQDLPPITPEEIEFWRRVADYYLCALGEVYKAAYPQMKNHKSRLALPARQEPSAGFALTPDQEIAADAIRTGFTAGKTVLLTGGPGKTDIYLKLALETLRAGRSVLYLLPEIAFSGQLVSSIQQVIPSVLLYHSGLTPGKRKLVAEALRKGEANLVLGTRSALFLPHHALGLIIVDEEQDPSFKQDSPAPRYHARESAIMLAQIHGAHVLLGSATPSLESVYNADCGRFAKVDLKERLITNKQPLDIIDMGAEYRKKGMAGSFSLKLLEQIQQTLSAGEQVVLIGPRRIYAGGKKMEDEVLEYCPAARIARLDGTADDQAETLRSFSKGEFDILLGNSMVTRGFESDKLGLVALVAADGILSRQDFRADERSLQILEQFRGRCRRMVIQTREPRHPVFSGLQDVGDAVSRMLEERRAAGYPPFTRMVKLLVRDANEKRLEYLSRELAGELTKVSVPVEGPYPVGPMREVRMLLPRDKALKSRKQAIGHTITAFEQARKYTGHIAIDVDPA